MMKRLEGLYPDDNDFSGQSQLLGGTEAVVKVGHVPIVDLPTLNRSVPDETRSVGNLLAGVAFDRHGNIVDYVLVPPQVGRTDDFYEIDWGARLAMAQQLFKMQNL